MPVSYQQTSTVTAVCTECGWAHTATLVKKERAHEFGEEVVIFHEPQDAKSANKEVQEAHSRESGSCLSESIVWTGFGDSIFVFHEISTIVAPRCTKEECGWCHRVEVDKHNLGGSVAKRVKINLPSKERALEIAQSTHSEELRGHCDGEVTFD